MADQPSIEVGEEGNNRRNGGLTNARVSTSKSSGAQMHSNATQQRTTTALLRGRKLVNREWVGMPHVPGSWPANWDTPTQLHSIEDQQMTAASRSKPHPGQPIHEQQTRKVSAVDCTMAGQRSRTGTRTKQHAQQQEHHHHLMGQLRPLPMAKPAPPPTPPIPPPYSTPPKVTPTDEPGCMETQQCRTGASLPPPPRTCGAVRQGLRTVG